MDGDMTDLVDSKICANADCGAQFFRREKDRGVSIGLLAATSSQMFAAHTISPRN
jgi:hypothetical protein